MLRTELPASGLLLCRMSEVRSFRAAAWPVLAAASAVCCVLFPPSATHARLPDRLDVYGQVHDLAASELARARVALFRVESAYHEALRELEGREPPPPTVVTEPGADGRYHLVAPDAGPWRLRVEADGFVAVERPLPALPVEIELPPLRLVPAQRERLRVLDPDGNPAGDSWWRLVASLPGSAAGREQEKHGWQRAGKGGYTDAEGILELDRGPDETLTLEVVNDWGRERIALGPAVGGSAVEHQPSEVAARITAEVVDSSGLPVSEALLLLDGRPLALSGEDGKVEARLVAGARLQVLSPVGAAFVTVPERDELVALGGAPSNAPFRIAVEAVSQRRRVVAAESGSPISGAVAIAGSQVATADPSGRFVLDLSTDPGAALWAGAVGYRPQWVEPRGEKPIDVQLEPAALAEGLVIDEDGRAVAGAELRARSQAPGAGEPDIWARSRDDGTFRLYGLRPRTAHTLVASASGLAPTALRFGSPEPFARRTDLRLVLERPRAVTGTVVSVDTRSEQRPLPEATVRVEVSRPLGPQTLERRTDWNGSFFFEQVPLGLLEVTVRADGHAPFHGFFDPVPSPGVIELGTLTLEVGVGLELLVTDLEGAPIEGAWVETKSRGGRRERVGPAGAWQRPAVRPFQLYPTPTDSRGELRIGELPRDAPITLRVSAPGFVNVELDRVEAPRADPLVVELAPAGSVEGWVLDEDGTPIAGTHVAAASADGQGGLPRDLFDKTDASGRFVLDGLPAGAFKVWARSFGHAEMPPIEVLLEQGEVVRDVVFRVPESALVEGRVLDSDGGPVSGAAVVCAGVLERTDGEGGFRLEGVPLGQQSLAVTLDNGPRVSKTIAVERGGAYVELVLERGVSVSGRVVGADREAEVALLWVSLRPLDERGQGMSTRGNGEIFELERVPPGRYRLEARRAGPSGGRGSLDIEVAEQPLADLEIVIDKKAVVFGWIFGLEPEELSRLYLSAWSEEGGNAGGRASADGSYRLGGLDPGSWTIRGRLEAAQSTNTYSVQIREAGEEIELDLELDFEELLSLRLRLEVDGRPLRNGWILLAEPGGPPVQPASTDYNGEVEIGGLSPGRYDLLMGAPGSVLTYLRTLDVTGDLETELALTRAVIAGTLADRLTGAPIAGGAVRVIAAGEDPAYRPRSTATRSDHQGRFRLQALVERGYRLWVEAEGYEPAVVEVGTVAPGVPVEAAVTLSPLAGKSPP